MTHWSENWTWTVSNGSSLHSLHIPFLHSSQNQHNSIKYKQVSRRIDITKLLSLCRRAGSKQHIDVIQAEFLLYMFMLSTANLTTLASHREDMSRKFFTQITEPTSCLHQLLPDPKECSIISSLDIGLMINSPRVVECLLVQNNLFLYTVRTKQLLG